MALHIFTESRQGTGHDTLLPVAEAEAPGFDAFRAPVAVSPWAGGSDGLPGPSPVLVPGLP